MRKLLLVLALASLCGGQVINVRHRGAVAAGPAPTLVNAVSADDGFTSGTAYSTAATSLTTGNTVWVVAGFNNVCGGNTATITDTAGNTYTQIGGYVSEASVGSCLGQWKSTGVTGHASNVYTVTWNTTVSLRTIGAIQTTGGSNPPVVDTSAEGSASGGTTVTSGPFTTTQANELLLAGMQVALTSCTADTGWAIPTGGQSTPDGWLCLQTKTTSSIQTGATTTMTSGGAFVKTLKVATFK